MIAVYRLDVLFHGMRVPASPSRFEGGLRGSHVVSVCFSQSPSTIPPRPRFPTLVLEGKDPHDDLVFEQPELGNTSNSSSWLTIEARQDFEVPHELNTRFHADPSAVVREVNALLEPDALAALRERVDLAAGVLAVLSGGGIMEEWSRRLGYQYSAEEVIYTHPHLVSHVIYPGVATYDELKDTFQHVVVALALEDKVRSRIRTAGHFYLAAMQAANLSIDQFLAYFLSLEATIHLFPKPAGLERETLFEQVDALLQSHAPGLLLEFARVRELASGPSLADRFALAASNFPQSEGELHVAQFVALRKLRNQIVHGGLTSLQPMEDGRHPVEAIEALATLYLRAFVRATTDSLSHQIVS